MLRLTCTAVLMLSALAGGCSAPVAGSAAAHPVDSLQPGPREVPSLDGALRDLEATRYSRAEKSLEAILGAEPGNVRARIGLARILLETGRYAAAAKVARAVELKPSGQGVLQARLLEAEALWRQGDDAAAAALLEPLAKQSQEAQLLLGALLLDAGGRNRAEQVLMRLVAAYNDDEISETDGRRLALVGRAAHLLRSPDDANEVYIVAERATPNDVRLLLWRAELFLDAHDPGQAEEVIQKALRIAPNKPELLALSAHIKLDQALDFGHAEELAERALTVNPSLARGYFVKAGLALRDGELAAAQAALDSGLVRSPGNLELLSMSAAARFLAEDHAGFAELERLVLARSPGYSDFYRIVGTYADWEHRYGELVTLMNKALAVDPEDAKARAILGFNLIRSGRESDGLTELRLAFDADPFDVRVVNTLNLYEKVIASEYATVEGRRFRIRYRRDEQPLLERYVPGLLERAWTTFTSAYGFEPRTPVGIELYSERQSFAVRTSGLPHTAIQGVCFGETLAVLTPRHESFNFGMTLWHELAHVFHIQLSKNRVPRWFTEGLAEYETTLARPEWRREDGAELHRAVREGRLPRVNQMNRAFTHAERLEDVSLAYYASSRLVASLASLHGRTSLAQLLRGWGEGEPSEQAIKAALGSDSTALDREFRKYLATELAPFEGQYLPPVVTASLEEATAAAQLEPNSLEAVLDLATIELDAQNFTDAQLSLERARGIAKESRTPRLLWLCARLALGQERWQKAAAALGELNALGTDGYGVRMLRAQLAASRHDLASEKAELEAAHAYDPSRPSPLMRLAMLADASGDTQQEVSLLMELAVHEPHDASVYRKLLKLLVDARRFDAAVRWGEAALWADIRGFETHSLWARAYEGVGDSEQALFELESALLCDAPAESLIAAHRRAEVLCRRLGRGRDARRHGDRAAELARSAE